MGQQKILIVEDNQQLANVLSLHLEELGYEFEHAADGKLGLDMALAGDHALIILDVMLPSLDGLEVCRQLRVADIKTPILILTSKSEEIDTVVGLEVGADDYVTKPFKVAELIARIKALLRRAQRFNSAPDQSSEQLDILKFDKLEIDRVKRIVVLNQVEIDLTAREFDLLYFLASQPGRPFSRNAILSNVCKTDFENYEYAVNSLIMRLRKKIEVDLNNPIYILTVRGVGYKFTDIDELQTD